jgi:steroid 5-alpha reductase family enzyme
MDKLWSILPIAYTWVIAVKGSMDPRLVIYAVIVTLWGIRLTVNFARKGAYRLKFWEGEEDYRWQVLRQNKYLKNPIAWAMFNLFFISIYQNALVLATCLPALACMGSLEPLGVIDYVAIFASLGFLLLELAADEQQMAFHTTKNNMLREGLRLEDLPAPFNKGFNTTGLWGRARHPNYLGEQGVWLSLYLFAIGAKVTTYAIFHWTMIGPLFLVFLFMGSSAFGEAVSSSKYPEYKYYLAQVSKYIPLWKYNPSKALPEDEAQPEAAE